MKCSPLLEIRDSQSQNIPAAVQGMNHKGVHTPWPMDAAAQIPSNTYPSLYTAKSSSSGIHMGQENGFGFSVQSLGTETSPDTSNPDGSGSKPASNHPTPSTVSNQNSSHTSYTSPPNQSGSSNAASTGQGQPSPGYIFGNGGYRVNVPTHMGQDVSPQMSNLNYGSAGLTPGPTGMTPVPDALWPGESMPDGNEWLFSWQAGSTPQPQ